MTNSDNLVSDPPQKRSTWSRFLLGLGGIVALIIALLVAWFFQTARNRATELAQIEADLDRDDPHWRLTEIEEHRETIPDPQNSARVCVNLAAMIPGSWPSEPMSKIISEGPINTLIPEESFDLLKKDMDGFATFLPIARSLANMPKGRHQLALAKNPWLTLLEHQQRVRRVAALLQADAIFLAQSDKADAALRSCRAGLDTAASVGDEEFLISQLIRIACVAIACNTTERVLALTEPSDAELAALTAALQREDAHEGMRAAFRGERAAMHQGLKGLATGQFTLAELGGMLPPVLQYYERLLGWHFRQQLRNELPSILRLSTRLVEITKVPQHERIAEERAVEGDTRKLVTGSFIARLLFPAYGRMGETDRRGKATVRCALAAVAVERYRRETGHWPVKLEDIPKKFLPAVPLDPFDGKPLRYVKHADGVTIYSVGVDGTDDGGKLDRSRPTATGNDIGFQLFDANKRRQKRITLEPMK